MLTLGQGGQSLSISFGYTLFRRGLDALDRYSRARGYEPNPPRLRAGESTPSRNTKKLSTHLLRYEFLKECKSGLLRIIGVQSIEYRLHANKACLEVELRTSESVGPVLGEHNYPVH